MVNTYTSRINTKLNYRLMHTDLPNLKQGGTVDRVVVSGIFSLMEDYSEIQF